MSRPLPYPGHTWSFTQHAVGLSPKTLYNFLQCAAPFEGEIENYDKKITSLMIASGTLTANERDGIPDAWRDYQQLLAELGLIYSTKICRALTITELGQMFLAGEIGFSELIGIQALRYQYPNGQKSTIQSRLRGELEAASIAYPETLTELQVQHQILIKPGLLILRVLLELKEHGHNPSLSVSECQAFLLPCRDNAEWDIAVSEIIAHRKSPLEISSVNRHSRRNIQDWFKFLQKSDFFVDNGGAIALSEFSLFNVSVIKEYCELQEDPSTYWIPTNFNITARLRWFDWFGNIPYSAQKLLRVEPEKDEAYVKENFVAGLEEEREEDEAIAVDNAGLNLKPIDLEHLGRDTPFTFSGDIAALAESLRKGAQKRHAKTLLHDRIVKDLAEAFISQGATVESDPDSIDLYAAWPDGHSAIFEVKTVTRRSIQGRLRTAIGQIEEYAYRRQCAGNLPSDRVIVVNAAVEESAWQRAFLTEHLGIGLICKPSTSYSAFAPASSLTKGYWLSI
ncbi:AlwI family type II restriction endonuclease [Vogesella indigofera]|uniref:AlwI family type II restriction endonuclease n=1 Tax=Vogesella indigofera TaxID=45465 RepID=UPI0035B224E4